MLKQTDQQRDQDAGLDSPIERLRQLLGVFKEFLTGKCMTNIQRGTAIGGRSDGRTRLLICLGVSTFLISIAGCQYYEEFRVKKATADLTEEKADLLHAYRLCLEKYQDEPPKAKEICAPYTQRLREIEVTHQ